ncbi:MAG TPA: pyruvate kinase [Deltaproteobacteria bacterium]|nr:pyruvate kinase [Deltaproteobacteria bacterium]
MMYEITVTLGPSSEATSMWKDLLSCGASGFRLNTSHLTMEQLHRWLDRLIPFLESLDGQVPLVLDLQGSKWRLGDFPPVDLECGQRIELVCASSSDKKGVLPVPHQDFFKAAPLSSGEIVLNDAKSYLVVEVVGTDSIQASVTKGGLISPRKGITFTSSEYRKETLNVKDQEILEQTIHLDSIRYALSYVKDTEEMSAYRAFFGDCAYLIAKLERKPALEEALGIGLLADELWLCRGDLGAEMGLKKMAQAVRNFSNQVGQVSVPVHLAGQVLEHMSAHPTPTRSEVCYLHDALTMGYRGLVLSDETAIGIYPVESCLAAALFRSGLDTGA